MRIELNGEPRELPAGATLADAVRDERAPSRRAAGVAVALDGEVVPRGEWASTPLAEGQRVEVLAAIQGGAETWELGGRDWSSRLIVGTGGFRSLEQMEQALLASGAEIVTVALRRVDPDGQGLGARRARPARPLRPAQHGRLLHGARRRPDRAARPRGVRDRLDQARGDRRRPHPLPDAVELLDAAETLVDEGFTVLPYTNDDPILARRLEEAGCAAVMPLGSPIGSGMGIRNPYNVAIIVERGGVPVILDAGIGTASDAALAMELGCDGGAGCQLGLRRRGPGGDGGRDARGRRGRPRRPPRRAHPPPPPRRGLDAGGGPAGAVLTCAAITMGRAPL